MEGMAKAHDFDLTRPIKTGGPAAPAPRVPPPFIFTPAPALARPSLPAAPTSSGARPPTVPSFMARAASRRLPTMTIELDQTSDSLVDDAPDGQSISSQELAAQVAQIEQATLELTGRERAAGPGEHKARLAPRGA